MARKLENGLLSIQDVFTSVVETDDGEKTCSFFIPAYQRGYKWTVQEVRKLLQDIKDFTPGALGTDSYCLQNITLKRDLEKPGRMNVVDGQQRLTTTLLLLAFLKYKEVLKDLNLEGRLVYGVRDVTEYFIKQEILSGKIWQLDAECAPKVFLEYQKDLPEKLHNAFLERNKRWEEVGLHDRNHSDIFHVYCAAMTIAAFFAQVNVEADKFAEKFWKHVCFLVNEVKNVEEPEIFSKINGFRVPLDGVDLLRAIFITNVARRCVSGARDAFEKKLVLAEKHVKLGLALDVVAAWWGKESHWKYFKLFDSVTDRDSVFDTSKYPLNYLYKLFVAAENRKEITLDIFERPNTFKDKGDICIFYNDLLQFNSTLKDWYEDKFIYYYAGFLCAQCDVPFAIIMNELRRSKSRRLFKLTLKKWILEHLLQDEEGGESFPEDKKDSKAAEAGVAEQGEQSAEGIKRAFRNKFDLWAKKITDNNSDWYGNPELHIGRVLVLLDVISFTKEIPKDTSESSDATTTYHPISDHLDPEFFEIQKEDKEHIFPRTPIGGKDALKNLDALRGQVRNYWELVVSKLKSEGEENPKECWDEYWNTCELKEQLTPGEIFPIDDIDEYWFKWLAQRKDEVFASVQKRINDFVKEKCKIDLNSIGNIVLLNQKTNRMYGNDFYPMKRNVILSAYRDNMSIRIHTRSVFAKEFPQDMEISMDGGLDAWTQNSIDNNRKYIKKQLEEFFKDIMAEVK